MPPSTSAVTLVVAGSCDAPGGILWRGAPFAADPNGKVVNFRVKFFGVNGAAVNSAVVIQTIAGNGEMRDGYNLACGIVKSTHIGGPVTQAPVTFVPGAQNGNLTLRTGRGPAGSQATPAAIRSVGACRRSPRLLHGCLVQGAGTDRAVPVCLLTHTRENGTGMDPHGTSGCSRHTPHHGRYNDMACGGRKPDSGHGERHAQRG